MPQLPKRAKGALILLMNILIVSLLCLIPRQSSFLIGIELLVISTTTWIILLSLDIKMLKVAEAKFKINYRINLALTQLALWPAIVAGFITIESGFSGLYWLVPGVLFSFTKSVIDAWVLLIEVNK